MEGGVDGTINEEISVVVASLLIYLLLMDCLTCGMHHS